MKLERQAHFRPKTIRLDLHVKSIPLCEEGTRRLSGPRSIGSDCDLGLGLAWEMSSDSQEGRAVVLVIRLC